MGKSRHFSIELDQRQPDTRSQEDRFIEIARDLGCDEDEAAFKAKLAVIARQKPKGEQEPAKRPKRK